MHPTPVVVANPSPSEKLETLTQQLQGLRSKVGIFELPQTHLLEIKGNDALSYLQTQVTQDVLNLNPGQGTCCAILDRNAKIQSLFTFYKIGTGGWLLTHQNTLQQTIESLERFHINEEFELIDHSQSFSLLAVQGPYARGLMSAVFDHDLDDEELCVVQGKCGKTEVAVFNESLTGERGFLLACASSELDHLKKNLLENGEPLGAFTPDPEACRIVRLEAGLLQFGSELTQDHMLPGTGLENTHVNYDKGCYVGQEIVARTRTYDKAPRVVQGALVDGNLNHPIEINVTSGEEKVGEILAHFKSSKPDQTALILNLKKRKAAKECHFQITTNGNKRQITVVGWPFHNTVTRKKEAKEKYEEALQYFSENDESKEDDRALDLLKEAIDLDPGLSDAYEVLGVLLGRKERYKEAIEYMHTLEHVDPACIMAQSNLSLYYMKMGDIESAEKHKAEATALQFKNAAAEAKGRKRSEELEKEKLADLERKVAMFTEVLELDDQDIPALYGLGTCHLELNHPDQGVPFLEKVLKLNEDYSVAYLNLGKCYEQLSKKEQAVDIYRRGIEVARQKGDLMPLKEMEQKLYRLKQ